MNNGSNNNVFQAVNNLIQKCNEIENRINALEENMERQLNISRCQVMRVKNGEMLPDDYLLNGRAYNDLSPERAFEMYNDNNLNFILLDVSDSNYNPPKEMPEAVKIPLNELAIRHTELSSKIASYLIISENGVKSIQACEMLNRFGYFNLNNVSGGYKFWPAIRNLDNLLRPVSKNEEAA